MKAPEFSLPDQNGIVHTLKDYAGKWLVVYFYPKDNSIGCTKEACNFRDGRDILAALGVEVVGINKDSVKSHANFSAKHDLNFTLLSDESAETVKAYGSWKPLSFMGHKYVGISRDTYLINPDGEIVKKYEGVDPSTHIGEIYKDLEALGKSATTSV